jgi:hypothetical protein
MDYFTGQAGMGGGIPPFNQEDQTIPATATETSGMLPAQSPLGFGGGQQPGLGQPGQSGQGGFFDTVGANRNALVGLGLGLMGGQFGNRFGQAIEGFQGGAKQDLAGVAQAETAKQHAIANAYQQQLLALRTAPQLQETGTDPYTGQKTFMWVTPGSTELKPANVAGQAGGASALSQVQPEYNDQGKDTAFMDALKQHDPIMAKAVQDISEGRLPAGGRNLQKLIPLASRYDQNFTGMQDYQTRLATARSFAAGKDAETVKSYNQALTHAEKLWDLIPKVEGFNVGGTIGGLINAPYGEARAALSPEYASTRKEYDGLAQAMGGELVKAARATGGSMQEAMEWNSRLAKAQSGAEMRGAIKGATDFLEGAMDATAQKKSAGMKSQFEPRSLLNERNQGTFDKIQTYREGQQQGQAAPNTGAAETAAPAPTTAPARPPSVPAGSQYSPSRQQWRDRQGNLYNADGTPARPVQQM